jgi:hypothetical protein
VGGLGETRETRREEESRKSDRQTQLTGWVWKGNEKKRRAGEAEEKSLMKAKGGNVTNVLPHKHVPVMPLLNSSSGCDFGSPVYAFLGCCAIFSFLSSFKITSSSYVFSFLDRMSADVSLPNTTLIAPKSTP